MSASPSNPQQLIVFTRYPAPGKVKTRLIPVLGEDGAAQLHADMTAHTLTQVHEIGDQRLSPVITICYTGGNPDQMSEWLGHDHNFLPQGEGDLGQRLSHAFEQAFDRGMRQVIVIGTDCPGINASVLRRAFDELRTCDVVLGPASDGGYYLIGLSKHVPDLFVGILWGTSDVFATTVHKALSHGLSITSLDTLSDVDLPENLPVWYRCQRDRS